MMQRKAQPLVLDAFPPHTRESADALAKAAAHYLAMVDESRRRTKAVMGPSEHEMRDALANYLRTP